MPGLRLAFSISYVFIDGIVYFIGMNINHHTVFREERPFKFTTFRHAKEQRTNHSILYRFSPR